MDLTKCCVYCLKKVQNSPLSQDFDLPTTQPSESLSAVLAQVYLPPNPLSEIGEVTAESILKVSGCSTFDQVKTLNLSTLSLSSFVLTAQLAPEVLACVTTLDLSYNQLRDISAVSACISLKQLDIRNNSLKSLAAVAGLSRLQVLNAASNKFDSLRGVESLQKLRELDVSDNRLQSFSQTLQILQTLAQLAVLEIDYTTCFLKTERAFDLIAFSLPLQILNGISLTNYAAEMDPVFLCKLAALNRTQLLCRVPRITRTFYEFHRLCPDTADLSPLSQTLRGDTLETLLTAVVREIKGLRQENALLRSRALRQSGLNSV